MFKMFKEFNNEKKTAAAVAGTIVGVIASYAIAPLFLMSAWGVVAPHLNAPWFNYVEMFAIYVGLCTIGGALFKKN
jgi:hypothetical protein